MKWSENDSSDFEVAIQLLQSAMVGLEYDPSYFHPIPLTKDTCYSKVQQAMYICKRILDSRV